MTTQDLERLRRSSIDRRIVVLLVDDQRFVGSVMHHLLATERDIELHCCVRATDAVARADEIGPAVILQDLVMPEIDGLTLVGMFRGNPRTARTPVIVLSGNEDSGTRARALAAGASDYMVKPPAKRDLIAAIRRHAGRQESETCSVRSAAAPDARGQETLDVTVIASFREADSDGTFTEMLIDQFVQDAEARVAALSEAGRRHDVNALKAAAHGLKGSASTMGANRLSVLCVELEGTLSGSAAMPRAQALIAAVEAEFALLRAALAAERGGGRRAAAHTPRSGVDLTGL